MIGYDDRQGRILSNLVNFKNSEFIADVLSFLHMFPCLFSTRTLRGRHVIFSFQKFCISESS